MNKIDSLLGKIKEYNPKFLIKGQRWKGNIVGEEYADLIFNTDNVKISTTEIIEKIKQKEGLV